MEGSRQSLLLTAEFNGKAGLATTLNSILFVHVSKCFLMGGGEYVGRMSNSDFVTKYFSSPIKCKCLSQYQNKGRKVDYSPITFFDVCVHCFRLKKKSLISKNYPICKH